MIPKLDEYKERFQIKSEDSIKPGLEAMEKALRLLGHPEKGLPVIHVAGTNGKGSTVAFMEAILQSHGFTTGVFSSPALIDLHDQIRLNGKPSSKEEMDASFRHLAEAGISGMLTDFELLTAAAFCTFKRNAPDYILLECGMGGTLDSTNVVTPLVSVITSVALDHVGFLGSTVGEIASHKAGIIKEGVPVATGILPEEASLVVEAKARAEKSPLYVYGKDFIMKQEERFTETFKGNREFVLHDRRMKGPHQAINAAVAIKALLLAGIKLEESYVTEAVSMTQLPFRFQQVSKNVFFDGAHNPAAARMLTETIQTEFPGEKVDFVIGMLKTKDMQHTLEELMPVAASFTFIDYPHPDAASAEQMSLICRHSKKRVTTYTDDTIILSNENGRKKIVAGSLYLISSLLDYHDL